MKQFSAEVAFRSRCLLGEGSLWDPAAQRLLWVDIADHKVFSFDPQSGTNVVHDVGESVGTVVPSQNGRLLVALRQSLAVLDPGSGEIRPLVPSIDEPIGHRFNDGKCDPRGRLWVGTMVEEGPPGGAALYCLGTNLILSKHVLGVTTSNGIAWNEAVTLMYYVDTATHMVSLFDFDNARGAVGERRPVAYIPESLGSPDGMTIDAKGHLWIALFRGRRVVCIDPSSGQIVAEVLVPALNVTSCAFGGEDLDELYITTARVGTPADELQRMPLAGSLFRANVGVRGVPSTPFARDL